MQIRKHSTLSPSLNLLLSVTGRGRALISSRGDFPIRAHGLTERAFPQAQAPSVWEELTEKHWRPVPFTSNLRPRFWLAPISSRIVSEHEVSLCTVVVDQAITIRTGKRNPLSRPWFDRPESLFRFHLDLMLVTKRLKFISFLRGCHRRPLSVKQRKPPPAG